MKTLSLTPGAASPPATCDQLAWMAGSFRGELFGGIGEERWCAPSAGSMMGVFKLIKDGAVVFYEILTIAEMGGSLVLRIKHFHPDLASWEEKEACFSTPLVKISPEGAWFDGFTYIRESERMVRHIIRQKHGDDPPREIEIDYWRVED